MIRQRGMSVHKYRTVFSVYTCQQVFAADDFVIPMPVCAKPLFRHSHGKVAPFASSIDKHKNRALLRPSTVMLPTRAASAFHAAVHDLRVARLVRLANKNVTTNVSIERFDYAGMMRAVELTRAELLLSGKGVSFQANRNTAALKPMMRPLPTSSRQPFAQM